MIEIKNMDNYVVTNKGYGGHSGGKKGIKIDGESWFIKYPKSTKSMEVKNLSYTTSPLSEYLGSHIYELIGIDVHKTILGVSNNHLVVACKDFLKSTEEIIDFNAIKNNYDENLEKYLEERHSSNFDRYDDLDTIIYLMNNNAYFTRVPELKQRFWDMFIIDALINNNDRNEANWGLILDKETNVLSLAPVYDNGASFYGKSDDTKLENILNDEIKFKQMVYDSSVSSFELNGKIVNPLKYIESMINDDCNTSLKRIFPKINLEEIKKFFYEIPSKYKEISVFSDIKKEAYYKVIEYRYNNILKNVYEKLK